MSLVHSGQLDLKTLISKLTTEPARIIGTRSGELGTLKTGCRADVTIFDPNKEWLVDSRDFASKGKNTPFDDYHFKGRVRMTVVAGQIVYKSE
jgi:dihydroorotase